MAKEPAQKRRKQALPDPNRASGFVPVDSEAARQQQQAADKIKEGQKKIKPGEWTVVLAPASRPPSTTPPVSAHARPKRKRVNSVTSKELDPQPAPYPPPQAYPRPTVPLPPHPTQSSTSIAHSGQVAATHAVRVSNPRRQSAYFNDGMAAPRVPTYEQPTQPPTLPHFSRGSSRTYLLRQSVDASVPPAPTHRQPAQGHLIPYSRYPNGAEEIYAAAAEGAGTYGSDALGRRASTYEPPSYPPPQSHGPRAFQSPQNYEPRAPQGYELPTLLSPQGYELPTFQSPRGLSSYGSSAFQPPQDYDPSFQPLQGDSFDGHLPLTNGTDSSDATATAPRRIPGRVDAAVPPMPTQGQVAQPYPVPDSPGAVSTYSLSDADAEGDPEFDEEDDRSTTPVQAQQPGGEIEGIDNDTREELFTIFVDSLKSGAPESVELDYVSTPSQLLFPTMDVATFVSQKERSEANDEGCGQELLSGAEDIGDATATTSEESPEFSTSSSRSTPARDVVTYAHSACPDSSAFPMRNDTDEDAPRASTSLDNGMDIRDNLPGTVDNVPTPTDVDRSHLSSTNVATPEPANVAENGAVINDLEEWTEFENTGDHSKWDPSEWVEKLMKSEGLLQ